MPRRSRKTISLSKVNEWKSPDTRPRPGQALEAGGLTSFLVDVVGLRGLGIALFEILIHCRGAREEGVHRHTLANLPRFDVGLPGTPNQSAPGPGSRSSLSSKSVSRIAFSSPMSCSWRLVGPLRFPTSLTLPELTRTPLSMNSLATRYAPCVGVRKRVG